MLGHTLGFYHPQILVQPTMPHPTMHFPVSSACTAYMAIPISTEDQKFKSWDPGSQSTQLIKKQALNLITRPLCGAYRQNSNHMLANYKLHYDDSVRDSLHLKNLIYPLFGHKHSYTSSAFVIYGPVELVPGVLALDCAAVATTEYGISSLDHCGAYTDRTVTTGWPAISFSTMILSGTFCTSGAFVVYGPVELVPVSLPLIVRQLPPLNMVS